MASKPNKFLETPLVSIIVPAFNVEAFLAQCLQSICGQTYKDLEIIVVDDNSSDSTGSILDSAAAADSRIKPIHLTDNVGLHRARAIGIEASIGSFIGVVDADDWIVSTMFETMLHRALKTDADITICEVTNVFPNGT